MGVGILLKESNFGDKNFGKASIKKYGIISYIQGDGESYIDTGFTGYRANANDTSGVIPDDIPKVEVTFVVSNDNSNFETVIGTLDRAYPAISVLSKKTINITGKGAIGLFHDVVTADKDVTVLYGSDKTYINGVIVADNTDMSNQYRLNAYPENVNLFVSYNSYNGETKVWYSTAKVKEFKAYLGDNLVLHLKPYRKKDNTVCMIDILTNEFYENKGTGTFVGSLD